LSSGPPPSEIGDGDQCRVLPHTLTEIHPNESVSQISSNGDPSIPSDAVSLISRAEKDELQWKANKLDAIARELRAIQHGTKTGLSTATLRDILGPESVQQLVKSSKTNSPSSDSSSIMGVSLLSLATSTAIPILLIFTLVTLSCHSSSATSTFPPLRHLHRLITSSGSTTQSTATIVYRTAKPYTGLTPHNINFLVVPILVVGSAVVGWNILCHELGMDSPGVFGKMGRVFGDVEEGWDFDWDAVREFFGMVEGI
jgi:hypothetical protein